MWNWKTVVAGLGGLAALLTVLNEAIEFFPTGLVWVRVVWSWLWGMITYQVSVPVSAAIVVCLMLLFAHDFLESAYPSRDKRAAALASSEPEPALSKEELTVMDVLIHADTPIDYHDLLFQTSLTKVRLEHALHNLLLLYFVRAKKDPLGSVTYFDLMPAGNAYAVNNDLDK